MNAFGFASGDPVNYGDPYGLCPPIDQCSAEQRLAILNGVGQRVAPVQSILEAAGTLVTAPLAGGIGLAEGMGAEAIALGATFRSGTGSGILRASGVAQRVAAAVGGEVSQLTRSEGFKVTVERGKNLVARIKANGEMRIGIDGLGSLTREGVLSSDRALTHLNDLSSRELIDLMNKAKDLVGIHK
jgi:hypothetical protein